MGSSLMEAGLPRSSKSECKHKLGAIEGDFVGGPGYFVSRVLLTLCNGKVGNFVMVKN